MSYDKALAQRTRAAVAALTPANERRILGGLAFMVNTHLACGLIGNDLVVQVGDQGYEQALKRGAGDMTQLSGRWMRRMLTGVSAGAGALVVMFPGGDMLFQGLFSGLPKRGMVTVPGPDVAADAELADWVGTGVAWALAQPPKPARGDGSGRSSR